MKTATTDNSGGWGSENVVRRFDPELKKEKRNALQTVFDFWTFC